MEVMLAMSVLAFAFLAMSQSLIGSMKLTASSREQAIATNGFRDQLEVLQGAEDFEELFALYNSNPDDDPEGPGTAPGPNFAVEGLDVLPGDPDGMVGQIFFPTIAGRLREDGADEGFTTPRDLNGDGVIDGASHDTDYLMLPVLLRLSWKGSGPESQAEVRTILTDR